MVGIKLNDEHTFDDYGLVLSSKIIELPPVKETTVDVTGADGQLDYTEFFGHVRYSNRTLTFVFNKIDMPMEELTRFQSKYHGQKVKIIPDDDSDYYYYGRISVSWVRTKNRTEITLTCNCEPYKIKNEDTVVKVTSQGWTTLTNGRKPIVPTITVSNSATIVFGGKIFTLSTGTQIVPEIELGLGENKINVTHLVGTLEFKYKEGDI